MKSRLGLALATLIACAGCGFVSAYNANLATLGAVVHDGFLAVRVSHTPEFPSTGKQVTVSVVTSGSKAEADGSASAVGAAPVQVIAHDAWFTFPYHFDTLSVTIVGGQPSLFAAAQLEATFGPRPTNLESANLASTVSTGWNELYTVVGAVIAMIVVDIVRVETRKRHVHHGRLLEAATAHEHVHLGQHEIDLWSGQAAHAHFGYETTPRRFSKSRPNDPLPGFDTSRSHQRPRCCATAAGSPRTDPMERTFERRSSHGSFARRRSDACTAISEPSASGTSTGSLMPRNDNPPLPAGVSLDWSDTAAEVHRLVVGPMDNNVYVVRCRITGEAVLIDTANEHEKLLELCRTLNVRRVLETHGHWDHIQAVPAVRDAGIDVGVTGADAAMLESYDFVLEDEQFIEVGNLRLRNIATPGHTPGSMCFRLEGAPILFSGDTLFPGGPGATKFPGGDWAAVIESIDRRLYGTLPPETLVLPGHGASTTIGTERPHLQEWIDRGW